MTLRLRVKSRLSVQQMLTSSRLKSTSSGASLTIVQAKYSILDRGIEDEIIPCCRENGVTIQAYSPLEMGLLSGTMPRDYKPVGAQIPKKWFQPENMQKAMDVMDRWKPLCEKYNCTIANLALAWILAQGDFINLLSGSTTVDQIAENVKSAELELEASDVAMMREMVEAIDKDQFLRQVFSIYFVYLFMCSFLVSCLR